MQQATTRLRCDPTEYARKQQEKKDRAKELKETRSRGVFSDDHTFVPKVNPRGKETAPPSREEDERPMHRGSQQDDLPIRPSKTLQASRKEILGPDEPRGKKPTGNSSRPNNNDDHRGHHGDQDADALDSLSRKFPKKAAASRQPEEPAYSPPTKMQPEHDSLYREVKRTTGHNLEEIPIAKLNASSGAKATKHTGPCLRNSSCTCPQCSGMGGGASSMSSSRADPPIRRREMRPSPADNDAYEPQSSTSRSAHGSQSEMENSLTLLKSKMSRRKARTAPSNQASLYDDDKASLEPASKSARQPPVSNSSSYASSSSSSSTRRASQAPSPPQQQQRQQAAPSRSSQSMSRNAPSQSSSRHAEDSRRLARHQEVEEDEDRALPPPISSGFGRGEAPDEYDDGETEMEQCPDCNRKFNITSFSKHQKICAKVFASQRKVFNMAAKRLEGTEAEKLIKESGRKGGGKRGSVTEDKPIKAKAVDWKQQSNAFRDAMRANRDIAKAVAEGKPLPPMAPSAPDPSLIPCDFCGRRFNEKAAERHIPFCKDKSQRGGGGPAKKPAAAAPPPAMKAPAAKAPAPRKR